MIYSLIFVIIFIILGIYFIMNYEKDDMYSTMMEGFINNTEKNGYRCPNILIQKGIRFFLYNSNLAEVPGVNPIEFQNLEDYAEFMEWQRSQGIRCPVLYLQYTFNAQGEPIYQARPSPTDLQGGISPPLPTTYANPSPSMLTEDDGPPDTSSLSMASNENQTITTDEKTENLLFSPNAMDDNWGGVSYTQSLVDQGAYSGDNVSIYIP
jgi:hypothetical protein